MTMNPPPPMPQENGSTTPSTPAAVTAASTALPPRFSVRIAAFVASVSTVAAAPSRPTAVGVFSAPWAAGALKSAVITAATVSSPADRRIRPSRLSCLREALPARLALHAQDRHLERRGGDLVQQRDVRNVGRQGGRPQRRREALLGARPQLARPAVLVVLLAR